MDNFTEFDPAYMNKAFMYGNAFIEPPKPCYGQMPPRPPIFVPYGPKPLHCPHCNGNHTLPPIKRPIHDHGYYQNPPTIPSHGGCCTCDDVNRDNYLNIINVESRLRLSLDITLYSVREEDDVKITLEEGKKYKIVYLSEYGLSTVVGILKYIDTTIPLECTRYINEYNDTTNYAHIIMDCSTESNSDIRKIFIRALRSIEEVVENTDQDEPSETPSEDNTPPTDTDNKDQGDSSETPDEDGTQSTDTDNKSEENN